MNNTDSTTRMALSILFLTDLLNHAIIDAKTFEAAKLKLIQSAEQSQEAKTA